jgi:glycosyltransferase involved in cell wall biosynthesis
MTFGWDGSDAPRSFPANLRISAIVPCYNRAAYLEEALASIRTQTRPLHEVIVIDDGSTDGSAEVAERSGVTVIRHGNNRGSGAARNTGWRAATGDAIAWLDDDDSWRPNHVEVVGALLERYPEAACAFGAVQRFGLDDQLITGLVPDGEPCEMLNAAFQSWLHTPIACIMRREALEEIGGFDEREKISVDFDLWLRLARHNRFVATREVTANWRWHEGQLSATPVRQILVVRRYRRRFLRALRADGEHALAEELEPLMRPSWTSHLKGVKDMAEQRRRRSMEARGHPYTAPGLSDQARWAVLTRLPPSVLDATWRLAGRALEP